MLDSKPFENLPLIAILRGIAPDAVIDVCTCLLEYRWQAIEIPLQSPTSFKAIEILCQRFSTQVVCGAGTITSCKQLDSLTTIDGLKMIISPHTNQQLIHTAKQQGKIAIPGVYTPSDVMLALSAGAEALKFFPASVGGINLFKPLKAIVPQNIQFFAVGGIGSQEFAPWLQAGIDGFGIGSELFRPNMPLNQIVNNAKAITSAFLAAKSAVGVSYGHH